MLLVTVETIMPVVILTVHCHPCQRAQKLRHANCSSQLQSVCRHLLIEQPCRWKGRWKIGIYAARYNGMLLGYLECEK